MRDLLLARPTHDHDVATPLAPERAGEVLRAAGFDVVPTGIRFGTLTAVDPDDASAVEVTTLRAESGYRDRRHPDRVEWTDDVALDLGRRDFTVNAMAWRPLAPAGTAALLDPFGGRRDLALGRLRAVGRAVDRFREDPLRVARLFRFAAQLGFAPDAEAQAAARTVAPDLASVAPERVREELDRLLVAPSLWQVGEAVGRVLLPSAMPLWRELTDFEESRWRGAVSSRALFDKRLRVQHKPVDLHSILAVTRCPPRPVLRWAALVHDLGKPRTFALTPEGKVTFYDHEAVSAQMAREALAALRLPPRFVERVAALVAIHLFPWEEVSEAGMRRLIRRLGPDGARDLLELHRADVEASTPAGWPAYEAARTALEEMLERRPATDEGALAVDGRDVVRILGIAPGPRVGEVLRGLVEIVLDDPGENVRERLLLRIAERRWT